MQGSRILGVHSSCGAATAQRAARLAELVKIDQINSQLEDKWRELSLYADDKRP